MKVYEVLDKLQFEIEEASNVPLTNKVMIDKDEILDIIDDLRASIPMDIAEAKRIREEEIRIKSQAEREAGTIVKEAREHKAHLVDSNTITKSATEEAEAIRRAARDEATRLRVRSIEYVTNMISKTQDDLREVINTLDKNKSELKTTKKAVSNSK